MSRLLIYVSESDIQEAVKAKGGQRLTDEQVFRLEDRLKYCSPLWDKVIEVILEDITEPIPR